MLMAAMDVRKTGKLMTLRPVRWPGSSQLAEIGFEENIWPYQGRSARSSLRNFAVSTHEYGSDKPSSGQAKHYIASLVKTPCDEESLVKDKDRYFDQRDGGGKYEWSRKQNLRSRQLHTWFLTRFWPLLSHSASLPQGVETDFSKSLPVRPQQHHRSSWPKKPIVSA